MGKEVYSSHKGGDKGRARKVPFLWNEKMGPSLNKKTKGGETVLAGGGLKQRRDEEVYVAFPVKKNRARSLLDQ